MSTTIRLNIPSLRRAPPAATLLGEWFAAALGALTPSADLETPSSASRQAAPDSGFAPGLYAATDRNEMLFHD